MTGPRPRDLRTLPKAHLHLHFTGSLRPATMRELAASHDVRLPDALRGGEPPELTATDERGWFRFQRLYDTARSVVRTEADLRRLLLEAAEDDRAEGSGWLEIQVDPTTYATRLGGLTPTIELILDAAREAEAATRVGIGVVIAANRTRHPLDARTLARLAARYAGDGRRRVRPVQRRAARVGEGLRAGVPDRGAGRARCPCRTAASSPVRRASPPAWTCSGPTGSATGCARSRSRAWSAAWPRPRPRWRSARRPTCGSASTPRPQTCRCGRCGTRVCRSRSVPMTRCSSAHAWSTSTTWRAATTR